MDREKVIKRLKEIQDYLFSIYHHLKDEEEIKEAEDICDTVDDALAMLNEQEEQIKKRDESLEKAREEIKWLRGMLKEQEAVKPRVSSVEQRCGNCNKVIEMDGWKACPWCGKPILWEAVGRR